MTIKELREMLADYPEDTGLFVYNAYLGETQPLEGVKVLPPRKGAAPLPNRLVFMDVDTCMH